MNKYEQQYFNLVDDIMVNGVPVYNERTGRTCYTIPNAQFIIEPDDPPPLFTTRKSFPVSAWAEMVGYLRRYEWATDFDKIGTKSWYCNTNQTSEWLKSGWRRGENHMGKVYGAALEDWELPELFYKLENHIDDRGLIIDFWKPEKFILGCLRPCMYLHHFTIIGDTLHLTSSQRSLDVGVGENFNSLSLYVMLRVFAKITGLKVGRITRNIVNAHIYDSHVDGLKEQLSREMLPNNTTFEVAAWVTSFDDIVLSEAHARDYFTIENYEHQAPIKFDLVA